MSPSRGARPSGRYVAAESGHLSSEFRDEPQPPAERGPLRAGQPDEEGVGEQPAEHIAAVERAGIPEHRPPLDVLCHGQDPVEQADQFGRGFFPFHGHGEILRRRRRSYYGTTRPGVKAAADRLRCCRGRGDLIIVGLTRRPAHEQT